MLQMFLASSVVLQLRIAFFQSKEKNRGPLNRAGNQHYLYSRLLNSVEIMSFFIRLDRLYPILWIFFFCCSNFHMDLEIMKGVASLHVQCSVVFWLSCPVAKPRPTDILIWGRGVSSLRKWGAYSIQKPWAPSNSISLQCQMLGAPLWRS